MNDMLLMSLQNLIDDEKEAIEGYEKFIDDYIKNNKISRITDLNTQNKIFHLIFKIILDEKKHIIQLNNIVSKIKK